MPAAASVHLEKSDFPDWLSPMLVKELRQGLRAPVFVVGFCVIHAVLGLGAYMHNYSESDWGGTSLFWMITSLTLLQLLPMRSFGALKEEVSSKAIDTLIITRLSAWKIVLGKWVSAAAIQVLFAVTVLPYIMLRYFSGGVDLAGDLLWLGMMLLLGVFATALLSGLSFIKPRLVRSLIQLGLTITTVSFGLGMSVAVARESLSVFQLQEELGWAGMAVLALGLAWGCFFFLDLGASSIAPATENRAKPRRVAAWVTLLLVLLAVAVRAFLSGSGGASARGRGDSFEDIVTFVLATVCTLAGVQAISESSAWSAYAIRPQAGKMSHFLFRRGWHSGYLWTLVTSLLAGLVLIGFGWTENTTKSLTELFTLSTNRIDALVYIAGVLGSLAMPLVLWRVFFKAKLRWSFWVWLSITAATYTLTSMIYGFEEHRSGVALALFAVPTSGPLVSSMVHSSFERFDGSFYLSSYLGYAQLFWACCAVWVLLAIYFAIKELRAEKAAALQGE